MQEQAGDVWGQAERKRGQAGDTWGQAGDRRGRTGGGVARPGVGMRWLPSPVFVLEVPSALACVPFR